MWKDVQQFFGELNTNDQRANMFGTGGEARRKVVSDAKYLDQIDILILMNVPVGTLSEVAQAIDEEMRRRPGHYPEAQRDP